VLAEHPDRARKLERIVRDVLQRRPYVPGGELPPDAASEQADLLKKLGYTGDQ
jgi:hypothetical protein